MDISVWGVVEFRPEETGADWFDDWLCAQEERLDWESRELDGVRFETHEQFEDDAREVLDNRNSGWICWRELDVYHTPESLQCLWGITEAASFTPVAEERGIPEQLSPYGRAYYDSWERTAPGGDSYHDCFGQTHLQYDELEAVDWTADATTRRLIACRDDGERVGPAGEWANELELSTADQRRLDRGEVIRPDAGNKTEMVADGGVTALRYGRLARHEAVNSGWFGVFGEMERLAETYGGEDVRLTVWFDR